MTISKVLIANRGEIACRILRACREAGLSTVAIYAQNDTGTIFTELADEAFLLEGDSIASTYLDQSQILEIAKSLALMQSTLDSDFLSERADFAKAVIDAGIQWVGPSPEAISKMGDKMTARITMRVREYP